jgi:hypothetical protein
VIQFTIRLRKDRRRDDRTGDAHATQALPGARHEQECGGTPIGRPAATTIHRWIRAGDLDRDLDDESVRYGLRAPESTKLDAYKPIIEARLAVYPELSSVRLLDEIRASRFVSRLVRFRSTLTETKG